MTEAIGRFKWEVRSLPLLRSVVIPHFLQYPLLSGKQRDFQAFAAICGRMADGHHRSPAGLVEIVRLASGMTPSGKRGYPTAMILETLMR